MEKYGAIIIGFGKGGKTLAGKLAAQGKKVALVEKSRSMYGGTCINVGCIPSKSLVQHGRMKTDNDLRSFQEKADWYRQSIQQKRMVVAKLREKNYEKLNQLERVDIIDGVGSFQSTHEVRVVSGNEEKIITGEQIFINTGSTQVIPPIEGIQGNPHVYNSETLMELETLPKELAIIGGGYIGLEFASMYAAFGSKVTVFQDGEVFIGREDRDMAEEIKKVLEAKGIEFKFGVTIKSISEEKDSAVVSYEKKGKTEKQKADAVLIATGRKPNTEGLQTDSAGIQLTDRGAIQVNENMQTNVPHIFAMGDVTGDLQFTYTSLDDFRVVWSYLQGDTYNKSQRENVPYSVFITPSYARVGLNETEALQAGYDIKIAKLPAAAIPKAQVLENPQGMLKAVIDKKTNQILGAMLLCEEAYEMINLVKLAMDFGGTYSVLRDQIFTHPTMSEALNDLFSI